MDWISGMAVMMGGLCALLFIGLPAAFAFLGINVVGAWLFFGGAIGLEQMVRNVTVSITSFSLTPIPLFVLMGELLFHTGVAYRAIEAVERVLTRLPGRLSVVSIVGGTAFATLSGSSIANTAMLGSTLTPEMLKRGYHPSLAMGPIMAVGGIAMLIPPSALAVMLGSLAGISISQLLIGGIVPGLLMAAAFLGYVFLRCRLNPSLAPSDDTTARRGWERWGPFVVNVLPLSVIFVAVVGSMLLGLASPTESAAIGALASLIATIAYRALTWEGLRRSLLETTKISVVILFILVASTTFSQILTFSGATSGFLRLFSGGQMDPLVLAASMLLVLLVLGCFVDQISMMMITLPFFMPLANAAGIDPVWLGVMMLISMEIGLLTPPFGILLMVMQGVAPSPIRLTQIYAAAAPYILIEIAVLTAVLLVPALAVWAPALIR